MSKPREPDPEGDSADAAVDPSQLATTCSACGGPLDEDGDCEDPMCSRSPYHLDEDDEPDYPEGELGEGDKDA